MEIEQQQEIFCYSEAGRIFLDKLVIPPIRGKVVGSLPDGKVMFCQCDGLMHFVYPQQIRNIS